MQIVKQSLRSLVKKTMKLFLITALFCVVSFAIAELRPTNDVDCTKKMKTIGVSDAFDSAVAHTLHSLTLDELKKFDPSATEDNYVPTIDRDLRSEQAILPYAPDFKTNDTDKFWTEGMKVLDLVLSHMNQPHWEMVGHTPLELVVHGFHMREMWTRVKKEFDQIGTKTRKPSNGACQCILDVDTNGVMKFMRFIAMALREPSLIYGNPAFNNKNLHKSEASPDPSGYDVRFDYARGVKQIKASPDSAGYDIRFDYGRGVKQSKLKNENVPLETLLLQDSTPSMPRLIDATAWRAWKNTLGRPKEHDRDAALFLHCAIEKARNGKA